MKRLVIVLLCFTIACVYSTTLYASPVITKSKLIFSANEINSLLVDPTIVSGGDYLIEYNENALTSVMITNNLGFDMTNASMSIVINDTFFVLNDSIEYIGTILNGGSINLIDAFNFDVLFNVPDLHDFVIETEIICDDTTVINNFYYSAYSPSFINTYLLVLDFDNYVLDPGETTNIRIDEKNIGGSASHNLSCIITTNNEHVIINVDSLYFDEFNANTTNSLIFNISLADDIPLGILIEFDLNFSEPNGYNYINTIYMNVGFSYENFESGGLSRLPWGFAGDKNWKVRNDFSYHGIYSASSGNISYNQNSSMIIDLDVQNDGYLSYFKKVSCEGSNSQIDDDYFAFYIDGIEKDRQAGISDWEQYTYFLTDGFHRLEWKFVNNDSITDEYNRVWLDSINFPLTTFVYHNLNINKESYSAELPIDSTIVDTLIISNTGSFGDIDYKIHVDNTITDIKNRNINGSYIECSDKYLNTGQPFQWEFVTRNSSNDYEWFKDIYLKFPMGIIIDSVSDFVGGSEILEHISGMGNGAYIHWFGEDDEGWGAIRDTETAMATVFGHADTSFKNDFIVEAEIYGDEYGVGPHTLYFELDFLNLGKVNEWLSLSSIQGKVGAGESDSIFLIFNTNGLPVGEYFCELLVNDNFNNENTIPISLLADINTDIENLPEINIDISVYPNPFVGQVYLMGDFSKGQTLKLELIDLQGRKIYSEKLTAAKSGIQTFNIKNNLQKGIYFLVISTSTKKEIVKIVKL